MRFLKTDLVDETTTGPAAALATALKVTAESVPTVAAFPAMPPVEGQAAYQQLRCAVAPVLAAPDAPASVMGIELNCPA